MDFATIHSQYSTKANTELDDETGRALDSLEQIHDGDRPVSVKVDTMRQLADILQRIAVTGSLSPATLLTTPVAALALGSGQTVTSSASAALQQQISNFVAGPNKNYTADQVNSFFIQILAELENVTEGQLKGRTLAMEEIAMGSIAVKDDGTMVLQEEYNQLAHQLQQANTQRQAAEQTAQRRQQQLDAAVNANAIVINPDGSISVVDNTAIIAERDAEKARADALQPERDALQAVTDNIKSAINKPGRVMNKVTLDVSKLSDEAKTALGL